jgi:hypothetical protein
MATALLITRNDIVKKTALNGNVDTDLFIQFVQIAQDTHIQTYLGTDLLVKIQSLITAGTLDDAGNSDYKDLLLDYVKPMLIHWSMVEYLPFASYTIANKGMYKHGAENSESVSKNEVDFLIEKQRSIAQYYTRRFIDFMCFNQSTFPEYNSNSNGDVYPSTNSDFGGWVI